MSIARQIAGETERGIAWDPTYLDAPIAVKSKFANRIEKSRRPGRGELQGSRASRRRAGPPAASVTSRHGTLMASTRKYNGQGEDARERQHQLALRPQEAAEAYRSGDRTTLYCLLPACSVTTTCARDLTSTDRTLKPAFDKERGTSPRQFHPAPDGRPVMLPREWQPSAAARPAYITTQDRRLTNKQSSKAKALVWRDAAYALLDRAAQGAGFDFYDDPRAFAASAGDALKAWKTHLLQEVLGREDTWLQRPRPVNVKGSASLRSSVRRDRRAHAPTLPSCWRTRRPRADPLHRRHAGRYLKEPRVVRCGSRH